MRYKWKEVNQTTNQINNVVTLKRGDNPSTYLLNTVCKIYVLRLKTNRTSTLNSKWWAFLLTHVSGLSSDYSVATGGETAVCLWRQHRCREGGWSGLRCCDERRNQASALVGVDRWRHTHHTCPQYTHLCICFIIWPLRAHPQ